MKRVIITGATSSVGIALINECIKNDIEIYAIVRKNSNHLTRLPKSNLIHLIEGDLDKINLLDISSYKKLNFDVFYHLAWDYTAKEYRNDPNKQYLNIGYTLNAVEMCEKLECKIFVGAGSQAEYGRAENTLSPEAAVNPETAYGVSKYTAYKLSSILCASKNIRFIWGRIFSAFGIYDNEETMIMYTIKSLLNNTETKYTKCEQMWDYIYLKDIGRAFYLIGIKGKNQNVYCIGSGKVKPLNEYINIIKEKIKVNSELGIGKADYSDKQIMYLCADISSLQKDTGFVPFYSFEEGIEETIKWYKDNH